MSLITLPKFSSFEPGKLYQATHPFSMKPENYYLPLQKTTILDIQKGDILLFIRQRGEFPEYWLYGEDIFLWGSRLVVPFYNSNSKPEMWVKKI